MTTPALDSVHTKGARIASAGTMYKPSLAFLLHCKNGLCPLTGRQKAPKASASQPYSCPAPKKLPLWLLKKMHPASGWCRTTSFLEAMAPEPSLQEKLVKQVWPLEITFSASKNALTFLLALWALTKDTLLSKVPGSVQVAKCSQVTALQKAFLICLCVAHVSTPFPDALMLPF